MLSRQGRLGGNPLRRALRRRSRRRGRRLCDGGSLASGLRWRLDLMAQARRSGKTRVREVRAGQRHSTLPGCSCWESPGRVAISRPPSTPRRRAPPPRHPTMARCRLVEKSAPSSSPRSRRCWRCWRPRYGWNCAPGTASHPHPTLTPLWCGQCRMRDPRLRSRARFRGFQ